MTTERSIPDLVAETDDFIRTEVIPIEDEFDGDIAAAGGEAMRLQLQERARARGIFAVHAPEDCGGLGLGMVDRAPIFEAAGYSLFGPLALNVHAPDEGNIHMLDHIASPAQREKYLQPLARGEMRSAFSMTEPMPGAGSDPSALSTRAVQVDGGWRISGRKRFITGADGAGFHIIMARTSGESGSRGGATMFLARTDTPEAATGMSLDRHVGTIDKGSIGGHCEITYTDLFVPDEDVLGAVDEGFAYAQVRLGPARMTHVMRWTGAARRAHEAALGYALDRKLFGSRLGDLGMAQQSIADNEIDLAATRALLMDACRQLDAGERANAATSMAKTFAAEALWRVADRSMQLAGGTGMTDELPIARIARDMRPFRVYDGASEVHRQSIAQRALRAAEARRRGASA